jgi:hypothetical protein
MGLLAHRDSTRRDVPLVMQPRNKSSIPVQNEVIDGATLYLCRQGPRWVVVMESPRVTGALPFRHTGRDSLDARFDLLTVAHQACPDATIMSSDGAITAADYEWRIDIRGIVPCRGDLGVALHRELSTDSDSEGEGEGDGGGTRPVIGRRCHWGLSPSVSGRPRGF